MSIIPELEEASKTYQHPPAITESPFSKDQDDTLERYYLKVPRELLMKYMPAGQTWKRITNKCIWFGY